jgi:hypothetical protein
MVTQADVQGWAEGWDAVVGWIAARFGRAAPRRRAAAYVRGLRAPVARKNGWQLAEAVGDHRPDGMSDFLRRMPWEADAVRDDLQAYGVQRRGDHGAGLVWDETGGLKKGPKAAGVARQDRGSAGRIENRQIGVFLGYAGGHGGADRSGALPACGRGQDQGPPTASACSRCGCLRPQAEAGLARLARAQAANLPFSWITGDSVCGADSALRRWAARHRRGSVRAVTAGLGLRPVTNWRICPPPPGRGSAPARGPKGRAGMTGHGCRIRGAPRPSAARCGSGARWPSRMN